MTKNAAEGAVDPGAHSKRATGVELMTGQLSGETLLERSSAGLLNQSMVTKETRQKMCLRVAVHLRAERRIQLSTRKAGVMSLVITLYSSGCRAAIPFIFDADSLIS
ncbi:hypothetical protein MHYP_G00075940 [Metynnis hypsauchen]